MILKVGELGLESIVRWDILKRIKGRGFFMHFQSTTRVKTIVGVLVAIVILALSLPVSAQSNSAIAQQFQTTEKDITVASLVSMQQGKANSIELANVKHANRLV